MFTRADYSTSPSQKFGKVEVHFPKYQKVDEVRVALVEIVHIKGERFSYLSGPHYSNSSSTVNAVHYKRALGRPDQMAKQEAVKDKNEQEL